MLIKICIIVPYQELIDLTYKTFAEHNGFEAPSDSNNEKVEYSLSSFQRSANDVTGVSLDADVIISRGATADALRFCYSHIPIVEIPMAGNDIIRCFHEIKTECGKKKTGIIGPMRMIYGSEGVSDIVGLEIKSYLLTNQDQIPSLIRQAVDDGCEIIVGGIRTVSAAERMGVRGFVPETGKDSVWLAITEAKIAARARMYELEKAQLFKLILNYSNEGIIAADKNRSVTVFNSSARKMLKISDDDIIGKKINDIIPDSGLKKILDENSERKDEICGFNDTQFAVNNIPIVIKDENVGSLITFQNITRIQELENKIRRKIHSRGHIAKHTFNDIIGTSEQIRSVIKTAKRYSLVDSNVLIIGKTGTGKELFAQSIHSGSPRKSGPFVAINCAALPESLLESELFGYAEGAFTGASRGGKQGLFEQAHGGTIFLDEISELPLKLQGRLLRVIQEKEIMRLGHDKVIPVDVRIISATNKNISKMAVNGEFREDLYYRLDVLKLVLPTLEERRTDIPLIVNSLTKKFTHLSILDNITFSDDAMKILENCTWNGNIRELQNIVERIIVMNQSPVIDAGLVQAILGSVKQNDESDISFTPASQELNEQKNTGDRRSAEIKEIMAALEKTKYNKTKAAKLLNIDRSTLWRKIREYSLL